MPSHPLSILEKFQYIKLVLLFALLLVVVTVSSCSSPYRWSQRLYVGIERDGVGYGSISNIRIEMHYNFSTQGTPGNFFSWAYQPDITAEAVAIEVPGHNPIFALLQHKDVYYKKSVRHESIGESNLNYLIEELPTKTILRPKGSDVFIKREETWSRLEDNAGERDEIPLELRPILVYFTDMKDPATLRVITTDEQLSEILGAPSRLVEVSLYLNNAPPDKGKIHKLLPWLPNHIMTSSDEIFSQGTALNDIFKKLPDPLANSIRWNHFAVMLCHSDECKKANSITE